MHPWPALFMPMSQESKAMTTTDTRRADADLRHETATLLQDLADRIRAGQVRRWQIETVLPSLRMCAAVLKETPRKGQ